MRLFLDIGRCDASAQHRTFPGKTIAALPEHPSGTDRGALFVCAEGVAERPDGEQAARSAADALSDGYYAAMEAGAPLQSLQAGLAAANQAVRAGDRGRAVSLAGLVLQGRRWVAGHAGDIRIWCCRDLQIKQLTRDHVLPRALQRAEVTRACGFAETLDAEFAEGELCEGDVFVLTSPGIHEALSGAALLGVLQSDSTAQHMAETIVQRARLAQGHGYLGVCVARVEKLPPDAAAADAGALPIIELPEPRAVVDGFAIEKLMVKSRRYRLYKAVDRESGEIVSLRFPDPRSRPDPHTFLREEWAGRRIESPFILKPLAVRSGRRTALYSAIEYADTENLAKRIRRKRGLPLTEALRLGGQLLDAIETLHEQGLIHRDIRANSLLYDKVRRQLWVLGVVTERGETLAEDDRKSRSSTLSYWAPELFKRAPATERSDIYAAGVTIYRMLTAKYPYGRIRTSADWREPRAYVPITRHREDLPAEIDNVLERACAIEPARRYANIAQFVNALGTVAAAVNATGTAQRRSSGKRISWGWWTAAGLAAGLAAYLYFALS